MAFRQADGQDRPSENEFEKILALFTDRHSFDLYSRQASAVDSLAYKCRNGVFLADLPYINSIVSFAIERNEESDTGEIFTAPLIKLMRACSLPLLLERSSDVVKHKVSLVTLLKLLGQMLLHSALSVQTQVSEILRTLAERVGSDERAAAAAAAAAGAGSGASPQRRQQQQQQQHEQQRAADGATTGPTTGGAADFSSSSPSATWLLRQCIEDSEVIGGACQVLASVTNALYEAAGPDEHEREQAIQVHLVNFLHRLSSWRSCVSQMISEGVLGTVTVLLRSYSDPAALLELLWNLLQLEPDAARRLLDTDAVLQIFNRVYAHLARSPLAHGSDLHNELLVLASVIAQSPASHGSFVGSGLLATLLTATVARLESTEPHLPLSTPAAAGRHSNNNNAGSSEQQQQQQQVELVQFERLQLLLGLLYALGRTPSVVPLLAECKLVKSLSVYLDPKAQQTFSRVWKPNQVEALQQQVISLLEHIVDLLAADFVQCGADTLAAAWLASGPGSGVLRHKAVSLLLRLYTSSPELLPANDSAAVLLARLAAMLRGEAGALPDETVVDVLSLVSVLCHNSRDRQAAWQAHDGPRLLLDSFLRQYESRYSSGHSERLVVSLVDALWHSVVPYNAASFVAADGVDGVLDTLEVCPATAIQAQLLSFLSDLISAYPAAKSAVFSWSGERSLIRIGRLLVRLWTREETRLQLSSATGVISDPTRPLSKRDLTLPMPRPTAETIADAADLRTNIYVLVCALGSAELNAPQQPLDNAELAKLKLIESYLELKVGELWLDVSQELGRSSVVPVAPDAERIDKALNHSLEIALRVQADQKSFFAQELEKEKEKYLDIIGRK